MTIKQGSGDHCNWFGDEDSSFFDFPMLGNKSEKKHVIQEIIPVCTNPQGKEGWGKEREPEIIISFFLPLKIQHSYMSYSTGISSSCLIEIKRSEYRDKIIAFSSVKNSILFTDCSDYQQLFGYLMLNTPTLDHQRFVCSHECSCSFSHKYIKYTISHKYINRLLWDNFCPMIST